jgi:hypothetical protein
MPALPRSVRGPCLGFKQKKKPYGIVTVFFLVLPADDPHLADCIQLVVSRSLFMFLTNHDARKRVSFRRFTLYYCSPLQDLGQF